LNLRNPPKSFREIAKSTINGDEGLQILGACGTLSVFCSHSVRGSARHIGTSAIGAPVAHQD